MKNSSASSHSTFRYGQPYRRNALLLAIALGATALGPCPTLAAIPSSRTIITRMAKNGGRGVFVIEQEIQFLGAADGQGSLQEKWIVQNAESMRLTVSSASAAMPARWDAVYRDGRRFAGSPDSASSEVKATNISPEFTEALTYFRSSAKYFDFFIRNKMLPPSAAKPSARISNINTYKPQPEPSVRLGREGGAVTWVFGEPTPVGSSIQYPGAWIEQDAFLLRKIRLPQQTEILLGSHSPAGGGFKLPRERTIVWRSREASGATGGTATAIIKVTSVRSLPDGSFSQQLLPAAITANDAKAAHLPPDPLVREFYARFR